MAKAILGDRRSSIEIVHEILSVCDNGGAKKTAIMYQSSLSCDQLRRYLSLLTEQDLVRKNEEGHFQVTPTGLKTLRQMSGVLSNYLKTGGSTGGDTRLGRRPVGAGPGSWMPFCRNAPGSHGI